MGTDEEPTIFELSKSGRSSYSLRNTHVPPRELSEIIPRDYLRSNHVQVAEVSERDLVAHFTRLSHRQYSVDLGAYPLGSCTMKYNPKICDEVASMSGLANVHPGTPSKYIQGWLELLVDLERSLIEITGMAGATLQPAAGAAGELTGLLLMRAYHSANGENRTKIIIPDTAHGTNPASVTLGGYEVVTVGSNERGLVDKVALAKVLDSQVAGIMLTNPNTLGLFEEEIVEIAQMIHGVGGLLYYDGANLNAILGIVRPGDMGFDVVHLNLHKTFATPHGGGGPGAGPVAVSKRLLPFLPGPRPIEISPGNFGWQTPEKSIGRIHSWHGNALVLARAYAYIAFHGSDGLKKVSERAVLNANWMRERLKDSYPAAYNRPNMHEVVLTASKLAKSTGIRAIDVAKALLSMGFHAPTIYFPLIVDEALMIEPTETESLETLMALCEALEEIVERAKIDPEGLHIEPQSTPVSRVDEARAARKLIPTFDARDRVLQGG
ncbi:MAG: aminomethyl-transferring glycine dehydrogenase subunit GcvPB [Acidimicrobiales bacterium]|nr:aminomethyl-transferring glycine dehydrogenase subunit GcvPB [Acidimicrobiales bacterium]